MIPETTSLKLVFLEMSSRRKLIGFVIPEVFEALIEGSTVVAKSAKLYHPVEALVHTMTRNFYEELEAARPGSGAQALLANDPQLRGQLSLNEMGDDSPLVRYYNDMRDRGPVWRLYYVYLAGCDYAQPPEPCITIRTDLVEVAYPYREESDQQLKLLYDAEVRKIDPKLMKLPPVVQGALQSRNQGMPVPGQRQYVEHLDSEPVGLDLPPTDPRLLPPKPPKPGV